MATSSPSPRTLLPQRAFVVSALVCAAAFAILAGCASDRPPRHGPREQPQPPLAAKAEFFSGVLLAEAKVTSFRHSMPNPERDGGGRDDADRSGPPPGGGGHMGPPPGGGGMGGGPGAGGPPPGGEGGERGSERPRGGGFGTMPRQTLTITLTNTGGTAVTISTTELNSLIGNFAPQPERLTLAPGSSESLQPVSGDAGGLLNWLDVTLSLRNGGSTETKVLHLVPTGEPAAPALPPPAERR
jgi:hypothetical protein